MRFALFFALLSGLSGYVTLRTGGGLRWLALWPMTSFAVMAAAYAGLGPALVGKRASGRIAAWSIFLHLPYLALTQVLWHLQRLLGEDAANEVAPGIWVGRRPYPRELPDRCKTVVDLTCEFTADRGVVGATNYLCFPTLDATPPSLEALQAISGLTEEEGPILFHCATGHGRSATCAAALMLERGLVEGIAEAEAAMKSARPGVGLNRVQRAALQAWLSSRGAGLTA